MSDPFDDRLRDTARAARSETEASLDVEAALEAMHRNSGTVSIEPGRPRHRTAVGWLVAAAALTFALSAGILFTRGTDDVATTDDSIPTSSLERADATMPDPTLAATSTTPSASTTSTTPSPVVPPPTTAETTTTETTTAVTTTTVSPPTTGAGVEVSGWRDFPWAASGVPGSCVPGDATCTQLVHDASGDPITYQPTTRVLTRHVTPEVAVTLPVEYGDAGFVVAAGPDDVVYLSVAPAVADEMAADVVAVTLADKDLGREIGRWAGVTNTVGDSSLVPTRDGLVDVGCCGTDTIRPAPDAQVLVPWLGRDGEPVALDTPVFVVEIEYPALTVNRKNPDGSTRTWTYEPAGDWMPRGMPNLTATFDGGFVAAELGSGGSTLARGYADGRLDQVVLGPEFVVVDGVDPAGRILVGDVPELDGWFARADPFANGVNRWSVETTTGADGSIDVGDTSEIAVESVVEFVDAVAPPPDVNEIRTIDVIRRDEGEWSATVTTANLFDDSVAAVRWELEIRQIDGRSFEVMTASATQRCQPGRGRDTFSTERCV